MNIEIDGKYITDNIIIDINDFYYEIINNSILEVNIEILLDNLIEKIEEKEEKEERIEPQIIKIEQQKEERCIEEEIEPPKQIEETNQTIETNQPIEPNQTINIFENIEKQEEYKTYYVYIVRDGDNIDTILTKYNVTKETLSEYNDLSEIKLGDKIIIPEKNANN